MAFLFTQQVKLLAGIIFLPLVALVAGREAQRCLAQARLCCKALDSLRFELTLSADS